MNIDIKNAVEGADIVGIISGYGVSFKKESNNMVASCPFHEDKTASFKIKIGTRKYKCFGCGEHGDVIDFLIKKIGRTFTEALKEISDPNNNEARPLVDLNEGKMGTHGAVNVVTWKQVVPAERKEGMFMHYKHGKPSMVWEYLDGQGSLMGCVCRFDLPKGKEVLPLIYATDGTRKEWRWLGFDKPRPLYNLDKLTKVPTKSVLVVEGEKTCTAAERLFPQTNCTTWIGGVQGAKYTDWSVLKGRIVILWPDNDTPGFEVMHSIYELIKDFPDTVVKWVMNPTGVEKGWDLADSEWGPDEARNHSSKNIIAYPGKDFKYGENKAGVMEWDVKNSLTEVPKDKNPDEKNTVIPAATHPNEDDPNGLYVKGSNHFRILGAHKEGNGMVYYFYANATKTVIGLTPGSMTKNNLLQLAPLNWWRNEFPDSKQGTFSQEGAVSYLIAISSTFGIFSNKWIRGRGAWMDKGRIVIHAGDKLFINGSEHSLMSYDSKYIYERGEELDFKVGNALEKEDASKLIDLMKRLRWDRPINAYLLAGWCVVAPICGALPWRPHIWITGGAGTGKTTVLTDIVRPLLGEIGLSVQGKTTEPFLRQWLRFDSLPVVFDEAEGENKKAQDRMESVLALVRASSSNDGGVMGVGGSNGSPMEFKVRSCFAFSSIGVSLTEQSDRSRVSVLGLMKDVRNDAIPKWLELSEDIYKTVTEDFCVGIRSRTLKLIPTILANIKHFSNAASVVIGEKRAGDQIGVLLAGAYSLVSDHVINYDDAVKWVKGMDWVEEKGINDTRDEVALMSAILEYVVRVETQHATLERTIGELILIVMKKKEDAVILPEGADARLLRIGIRVILERVPDTKVDDWFIYVSNSDKNLIRILDGTSWAKNHSKILIRLPGAEKVENMRFASGVKTRAIKLYNYVVFKGFESDESGRQLVIPDKVDDLPF